MSENTEHTVGAAKPPVGVGASPLVAQLLALALVALGVVGVQDLLARTGAIAQEPWTQSALTWADGTASDSPWVLVGGIVAVVLGLLLLPIVFRRRPRKTIELQASTGVRLRTRDLSKLVRGSLEGANGVTDVDVTSTRRSVKVTATTVVTEDRRDAVTRDLEQRLQPTLAALESTPSTRIKLKEASA